MQYRKEIDGLRALAVIPVILFHAGFEGVSGGFIGVDIFFVISGYLITSILLKELESGSFTLLGFYERRIRRILPALFFVLLVCLPFAWMWLLPHELKDFGKSIIAVVVFASNILFWRESDYFAADAEMIPLLHTWSLAVEEQYYVFFPVLLMLLWPLGKQKLVAVVTVIGLVSLGFTEFAWRNFPEANFFLIITRAWELMMGGLVAFYHYYQNPGYQTPKGKKPFQGMVAQVASATGLLLILYAIFFFDRNTPFPSLYALIPTMGAALIILFATPKTWVNKLLSLKLMVGIGLISYSAYLWHQPLFVFARFRSLEEPNMWVFGGLSLVTFLLAFLSWRFVEKPFRNKQRFTRQQVFIAAMVGSFFFIGLGLLLILSNGAMFRFR